MTDLLERFITPWVVIDLISTSAVVIGVTGAMIALQRRSAALLAAVVSIAVLPGFRAGGQIVIEAPGLRLHSLQVAGGIMLLLLALTMNFGEPEARSDIHVADAESRGSDRSAPATFAHAAPSLACPGAMLPVGEIAATGSR